MRAAFLTVFLLLEAPVIAADAAWQVVDEGFQFSIPAEWKKEKSQGIDSHVGKYRGKTAYLEFDGVYGLGRADGASAAEIGEMTKKEADAKLLHAGEEIWHVDGRFADVDFMRVDPQRFGKREYGNVARMWVPTPDEPAYLVIFVFYESEKDVPTVRQILQSFRWPKKSPTSR